jgi:glycosyltransferase involved in cell wall biosynthesis
MIMRPSVAIVLPVYSWKTNYLAGVKHHFASLLQAMPEIDWTFIIVDDGSAIKPDAFVILKDLKPGIRFCYYHYEINQGKGHAVRFGFHKAAHADYYVYTDHDFPFGLQSIMQAVRILQSGNADIVVADRGKNYLSLLPYKRRLLTRFVRTMNRSLLGLHFTDTQAGLKAMNNRGLAVMLHTVTNGFLFDLEFVRTAERRRLRVHPLPVVCRDHLHSPNFSYKILLKQVHSLFTILNKEKNADFVYHALPQHQTLQWLPFPADMLAETY